MMVNTVIALVCVLIPLGIWAWEAMKEYWG